MMRRILFISAILVWGTIDLFSITYYKRSGTSGNWNATAQWSTVSCVSSTNTGTYPGATDDVIICSSQITANANYTCASITATGGSIEINNTFTLTVTGNATLTSTTILVGSGTAYFTVNNTLSLTGCTIGAGTTKDIIIQAGDISQVTTTTTLGSNVTLEKTGGAGDNIWSGGNTFQSNAGTIIKNSSSSASRYIIRMANVTGDTYNKDVTFEVTSTGRIYPAYNGTNNFNDDIHFKLTGTGVDTLMGVYFCMGTGTATLASTKNLDIASATNDVTKGKVYFRNFTQSGTTNMNTFNAYDAGSATLVFGPGCTWNGRFSSVAWPNIQFNGAGTSTFTSNTLDHTFEATNAGVSGGSAGITSSCVSIGGNTFGSAGATNTVTFLNRSGGTMTLANNAADVFNSNVIFTVSGQNGWGAKIIACNKQGTQFNGNVTLNSSANGCGSYCYDEPSGITIEGSSSSHVTLASGKTITAGGNDIKSGAVIIKYFDQLGTTNQNLQTQTQNITNYIEPTLTLANTTWGASSFTVQFVGGSVTNSVFNGTFDCTIDQGSGSLFTSSGNWYKGDVTINNPTIDNTWCWYGYKWPTDCHFSSTAVDLFDGNLTINNTGTYVYFLLSKASGTTYYNGNITLTNQGGDDMIGFGTSGSGSSELKSGKTISVSAANGGGYSCDVGTYTSVIALKNFTQLGSTAQSMSGGNNTELNIESSTFNGGLTAAFSMMSIKNSTFNGTTSRFENTGGGTSWCGNGYVYNSSWFGGNKFKSTTTTFSNTGPYWIETAVSANDSITGNLVVESTTPPNSCSDPYSGIYIGGRSGSGITYLTQGKSVTTAGGVTFDAGQLSFRNFKHGTTAGAYTNTLLALTADASIYYGTGSNFYCNWSSESPHLYLNGSTFESTASLKRIAPNTHISNDGTGGCTFKGATTIINVCTNANDSLQLATVTGDTFNGDVTFTDNANNAPIKPAMAGTNSFKGNITVNGTSTTAMTFGGNGGIVQIDGTGAQTFDVTGSNDTTIIKRLTVNKSSQNFTLNDPIDIVTTLTLTNGLIVNAAATKVIMRAGSSATSTATSFITGPVKKIGNTAFIFPVGSLSPVKWARTQVTPTGTTTVNDAFTAQYYYGTSPSYPPTTKDAALNNVSYVEYWMVDRTAGSANAYLRYYWENSAYTGSTASGINMSASELPYLCVAHWKNIGSGYKWYKEGTAAYAATGATSGYVETVAAVTSFSPFSFGSTGTSHPLPIGLIDFTGEVQGSSNLLKWSTLSETHNDYFTLEKSQDGSTFSDLAKIPGAGNSSQRIDYDYLDEYPYNGVTYYRLRQTDYDNTSTYSQIIFLTNTNAGKVQVTISPNPCRVGEPILMTINGAMINNTVNYTIYNNLGQKLSEGKVEHDGKHSVHAIDYLSNMPTPGNYTISLVIDNKTYRNNIIIK